MRIGTTPTYYFTMPFDVSLISVCKITFSQYGVVRLEKGLQDCTIQENTLVLTLTQQETFLMQKGYDVEIQVRVLTTTGNALSSDIYKDDPYKCLDREVLSDEN